MARPRTVPDDVVLRAAAEAVRDLGPAALTLAEIGRRAGLSPATLLQRFGSKRGLLLALARHSAQALPLRLRSAADSAAPVEALVATLAELAGGIRSTAEFAHHLAFLLLDLTDPDFQEVTREHAGGVEAAVTEVLAAALARGHLPGRRPDDLPALGRAVHAAYNGALVTWGMTGDGTPGDEVRRQLHHLLPTPGRTRSSPDALRAQSPSERQGRASSSAT